VVGTDSALQCYNSIAHTNSTRPTPNASSTSSRIIVLQYYSITVLQYYGITVLQYYSITPTQAISWRDLDVTVDDTIFKFKRPVLVELPLPPSIKEEALKEEALKEEAVQVPPLDASVLSA